MLVWPFILGAKVVDNYSQIDIEEEKVKEKVENLLCELANLKKCFNNDVF